ncbi:UBX domain-containing protein 1-like [Anneissia japonica]|uniref:UBX domain-containing protein 1-like n=1 Tax=Anneissia japonica TaxID=1529436 RepID=UPI0014259256|nr:UBX domain-containing protein 1-like [Anneissia japonica]
MPTDVEVLIEMGFSENRARRALAATKYKGAQVAMDWLFAHADDPGIDDPIEEAPGQRLGDKPEAEGDKNADEPADEAKSIKCDECGKKLKTESDIMMHAARTGHSGFSESTEEIKPLTEEEKKEQLANTIRLTDGSTLTNSFEAKEPLAAVRLYIDVNRKDGSSPFSLMTPFPRKVFTDEDMAKPLSQLGLVPSAVLTLTKPQL